MTRMGAETKIEEYVWVLSFSSIGVGYASFVGQKNQKTKNKKPSKTISKVKTLEKKVDMPAFRSKIRR